MFIIIKFKRFIFSLFFIFVVSFCLTSTAPQVNLKKCFVGQFIPVTQTANASPLIPLAELGDSALGALGLTVSAPAVVGVASVLILGGVAFHYRSEIEGVCGYIADKVKGAVLGGGTDLLIDGAKVKDAYNEMKKKGIIGSALISNFDKLPDNCVSWYNGNYCYKTGPVSGIEPANLNVPSVDKICGNCQDTVDPTDCEFRVRGFSSSTLAPFLQYKETGNKHGSWYGFTQAYAVGNSWCYPFWCVGGGSIGNAIPLGRSFDVPFPSNLPACGDIGNDTFARIPKSASVSAQNVVDMTAPQIAKAKDIPLSVQSGEAGVAVPVGKVLNPDGSIPLTTDGDIAIPKTGTAEGTATGTAEGTATGTAEGTATGTAEGTGDITGSLDKPIDVSLDFSPINKIGSALTKVFPFCIPWDLVRAFKTLRSPSKESPKWDIKFDSKYFKGGGGFTIDFSRFETFAEIIRFFVTLSFTIFLIIKTRDLIKG